MYTDSFEKIIGPLSEAEKKNAPPVIFSEGDISFLKLPIISIIGSRKGHLSNETATLGISLGSKCCSFIRRNAMTDLLCFFIYHWFCHTPALPDGLKAEAAASGRARYHRFIEMLKRKRLGGESLAKLYLETPSSPSSESS